jgi:hypothetical protein
VEGYESFTPIMANHPKDRHVLAAAVRCGALTIVTLNLKDFPEAALSPWDVVAQSPDEFLVHQYHLAQEVVAQKLHGQAPPDRKACKMIAVAEIRCGGGGHMLNPENNASSNSVSPERREWVTAEYEAGYAARFADASESLTATHCWRVGWEDVKTELSESARQNRLIAEGREGEFTETWFILSLAATPV